MKGLSHVSVIIPAYNCQDTIGFVLRSIINQNYPKRKYEVIVVNDASIDKTRKIIEKFQLENPKKIKVINNKNNQGLAKSINIGIATANPEKCVLSRSHYIIVLHDDCVPISNSFILDMVLGHEGNITGIEGVAATTANHVVDTKNMDAMNASFAYIYGLGEEINTLHSEPYSLVKHFGDKCDCYNYNVLEDNCGRFGRTPIFDESYRTAGEDTDLSYKIQHGWYKYKNQSQQRMTFDYKILKCNNTKVLHAYDKCASHNSLEAHFDKAFQLTENGFSLFLKYRSHYKMDNMFALILFISGWTALIGIYHPLGVIGFGWFSLKALHKALRYVRLTGEVKLAPRILIYDFVWEIASGIGWWRSVYLYCKKKLQTLKQEFDDAELGRLPLKVIK